MGWALGQPNNVFASDFATESWPGRRRLPVRDTVRKNAVQISCRMFNSFKIWQSSISK